MAWLDVNPEPARVSLPNYGGSTVITVTNTSQEVVAVGTSPRFMSVSVSNNNTCSIYVNYGVAVDVANGLFKYRLPPGLQHNQLEIPQQAVFMATAETGQTAEAVIAVAQQG